jgi:outer membrane protein assembly factor BamB
MVKSPAASLLIYFNSAHGRFSPIFAISKDAYGDLTIDEENPSNEFVKWFVPRGGSYMQTMVLYNGLLYNLQWNGQLDCYDAESGEVIYKEKLGKARSFTASPVIADGVLYAVGDKGEVYSVKCGKEFEIIAENDLRDISMVTPAITDGIMYFRTRGGLVAISKK